MSHFWSLHPLFCWHLAVQGWVQSAHKWVRWGQLVLASCWHTSSGDCRGQGFPSLLALPPHCLAAALTQRPQTVVQVLILNFLLERKTLPVGILKLLSGLLPNQ